MLKQNKTGHPCVQGEKLLNLKFGTCSRNLSCSNWAQQ